MPGEVVAFDYPAGQDQLIVAFVNQDDSSKIDVDQFLKAVAEDAATKELEGWRLVSIGGLPMRQMGTAGNIMFQSGGQYATQAAVVVIYARDDRA